MSYSKFKVIHLRYKARMFIALSVISMTLIGISIMSRQAKCGQETNYALTKEDLEFLKQIAKKDRFIRELPKGVSALDGLNQVLSLGASGPASLVLQWNKGLIAGWRKANDGLAKIGKYAICQEIVTYSLDSPNKELFENLADARGCNE